MKKGFKITLGVLGVIVLLFGLDLVCILTINRPIFAIQKEEGTVYKGFFYDTYSCAEYSVPQIKAKGTKFSCSDVKLNIGKIVNIIDKTKNMNDFACAEAIEEFYEDDTYRYYWSCIKNDYMVVIYENGQEELISVALKHKVITINDLDIYDIDYIKQEKNNHY